MIESWRRHYNAVRPHASLGYRPPAPEVFVPALAAWLSAHSNRSDGHAPAGAKTAAKLTLQLDHSRGADQACVAVSDHGLAQTQDLSELRSLATSLGFLYCRLQTESIGIERIKRPSSFTHDQLLLGAGFLMALVFLPN